jgi:hypothetical protein
MESINERSVLTDSYLYYYMNYLTSSMSKLTIDQVAFVVLQMLQFDGVSECTQAGVHLLAYTMQCTHMKTRSIQCAGRSTDHVN